MIGLDQLSVVIPTRNRPHTLKNLLHSIHLSCREMSGSLEVIIADDCSDFEWSIEDPRSPLVLKRIQSTARRGPSAARNLGAKSVRSASKWLLFLDDDVIMDESYFCSLSQLNLQEELVGVEGTTLVNTVQSPFEVNPSRSDFQGGFGSGNILYRKDVFERAGGFEESFFHSGGIHFREDTDLGLRMLAYGEIFYSSELRVFHESGSQNPWFLLEDARKYFFEPLFLYRNPNAREWIGTPFRKGKLGTYQTRGLLSDGIVVLVLLSLFVSLPLLPFVLGGAYGVLAVLLTRGYQIRLVHIPRLLFICLAYPWIHSFHYWKGFVCRVLPMRLENWRSSRIWPGWISRIFSRGKGEEHPPRVQSKKGLRILQVVRQFHPSEGGMENFVKNLSIQLLRLGHEVEVLTLQVIPGKSDDLSERELLSTPYGSITISRTHAHWYGPWFVPDLSGIDPSDYDLVHLHGTDGFLEEFVDFKKRLGSDRAQIPYIFSTHGGFFHSERWKWIKKIWFHTKIREQLKYIDLVAACSEEDARIFSEISEGVIVLENGVEMEDLLTEEQRFPDLSRLLFVGGLFEHKGVEDLLSFMEAIGKDHPEVTLEIIGAGPRGLELESLAHQMGLETKVRFLGSVSRERLVQAYGEAGLFISASQYEGFGISVVEAMASGCLLLLNEIPAFQAFLGGEEGGELTSFRDLEGAALAYKKMRSLGRDELIRGSRANRERSKVYSWKVVSEEFERHYMAQLEEVAFPSSSGSL